MSLSKIRDLVNEVASEFGGFEPSADASLANVFRATRDMINVDGREEGLPDVTNLEVVDHMYVLDTGQELRFDPDLVLEDHEVTPERIAELIRRSDELAPEDNGFAQRVVGDFLERVQEGLETPSPIRGIDFE